MPSKRKRIGYLPSINAQETITKIANKENLSQSKVVGILVEEALTARGSLGLQNSYDLIRKNRYEKKNNRQNFLMNYNDIDILISDKGIIYNTKKNYLSSEHNLSETNEKIDKELYEQFRKFIQFKRMKQDK